MADDAIGSSVDLVGAESAAVGDGRARTSRIGEKLIVTKRSRKLTVGKAAIAALACLAASYGIYRYEAAEVGAVLAGKLPLKRPFKELPLKLGAWKGKEVPLEDSVVKVAAADDYLSRWYYNENTGESVRVYVPYYGNPRTMIGHYPDVCYPAVGWKITLSRVEDVRRSSAETTVPALFYKFQKGSSRVAVMSFYIVGGTFTADRRVAERAAHIAIDRENRNYLAQMQLTFAGDPLPERVLRTTADFLGVFLPELEGHLPDSSVKRIIGNKQ